MASIPPVEKLETMIGDIHKIFVFADADTREVLIDFPEPRGGIIKPTLNDEKKAVLRFKETSPEQKAYYNFWANGTDERIKGLIKEGEQGAGLRQTLKWLINLRIEHTFRATGWRYQLVMLGNKQEWERVRRKKDKAA